MILPLGAKWLLPVTRKLMKSGWCPISGEAPLTVVSIVRQNKKYFAWVCLETIT